MPLPAAANFPSLALSAPVNAPLVCPNNSLSIRLATSAPHETTKSLSSLRCENS